MEEKQPRQKPFFLFCPNKIRTSASLLLALIGIFLLPKTAHLSGIAPDRIIELVNRERGQAGLERLAADDLLIEAAARKGQDLLAAQIFSHTLSGRKFSAWIKDAGYAYSYAGENLAMDFQTSEGAVNGWLDSPLHKKNILNDLYKETGVAAITGNFQGQETTIIVQLFGAPPQAETPVAAKKSGGVLGTAESEIKNKPVFFSSHDSLNLSALDNTSGESPLYKNQAEQRLETAALPDKKFIQPAPNLIFGNLLARLEASVASILFALLLLNSLLAYGLFNLSAAWKPAV